MQYIQFPDKCVSYDTFMDDLAKRVAHAIKHPSYPEYMSQRQAYAVFGRGNIDRWRRNGKIEPCVRPGKPEYRTADLLKLQQTKQDYFLK